MTLEINVNNFADKRDKAFPLPCRVGLAYMLRVTTQCEKNNFFCEVTLVKSPVVTLKNLEKSKSNPIQTPARNSELIFQPQKVALFLHSLSIGALRAL